MISQKFSTVDFAINTNCFLAKWRNVQTREPRKLHLYYTWVFNIFCRNRKQGGIDNWILGLRMNKCWEGGGGGTMKSSYICSAHGFAIFFGGEGGGEQV